MPDRDPTPDEVAARRAVVEHIPAWLDHLGLKRRHILDHLGVSEGTLSKWLSGKQAMEIGRFQAIAEMLGVTVAELAGPPSERDAAKAAERILAVWKALPPDQRATWLAMGEALANAQDRKT